MEEAFVPIEGAKKSHTTQNGTPSRRPDTNHKGRCAKQVFVSIEIWNKPRPDRVTPTRRLEAYTRKVKQEPSIRSRIETDPTRKGDPIAKTYSEKPEAEVPKELQYGTLEEGQ